MAARKAKTETLGSNVPKARAKSAIVETELQSKATRSDLPYEAITQQIAYLMSAITNHNLSKNNECSISKQSNGNGKFSKTKFQRSKKDRKDMKCWGCGVLDMDGKSVPHPGRVIISLSDWPTKI